MSKHSHILIIVASILGSCLLNGCNVAKRLPQNERLYAGAEIRVQSDSVSEAEQSTLKGELQAMARPRPNKRLFGYPYKVALYYLFGEPSKENSFAAWFRRKFGEPPVFASAKAVSSNQTIMTSYLENEGYFRSQVTGRLEESGYNAKAIYQALIHPRYHFDSITFLFDSTNFRKDIELLKAKSLIKKGDPYRFEIIKAEQARLGDGLKKSGFYYFQPDYIAFLADSSVGTRGIRLYLAIKPEIPEAARLPYYIRNIYIYPNYSLTRALGDTNARRRMRFGRFFIVDTAHTYKPKLFRDIVSMRPGQLYDSRTQDLTLSRFINVGAFKFVRNRFEPGFKGDTAVLDVHYTLTPYPKKSARVEIAGVTRSNSLAGSQLTVSWLNRNALRRAELLTINANFGVDVQVGGGPNGLTNFRYGTEANVTFPRLVSPIRFAYDRQQAMPKTTMSLAYERLVRNNMYYGLNSFRGSYNYTWRTSFKTEHNFQPLGANYVRTSITNYEKFIDTLVAGDPFIYNQFLQILLADQLILNSAYSFDFNSSPHSQSPYTFRIMAGIEGAGNTAGLLIPKDSSGYRSLFGVPIAQYVRLTLDNRHYLRLGPRMTWANRIMGGFGIPYGNSSQLPFVKQFFAGGSNSLRGFRPRAVGPAGFSRSSEGLFFQEGGGDIQLEFNTELRPRFTSIIQGALFVDVGNVWMFRDESVYGPGTRFSANFYKQLAVSAGAGVRLDFSYFILRLDLATPLRKPWLEQGSEWVLNRINFKSPQWRQENLVLNIAVGYPF